MEVRGVSQKIRGETNVLISPQKHRSLLQSAFVSFLPLAELERNGTRKIPYRLNAPSYK